MAPLGFTVVEENLFKHIITSCGSIGIKTAVNAKSQKETGHKASLKVGDLGQYSRMLFDLSLQFCL